MDEFNETVKHRNIGNKDEPKVLNQDEQQKIIDDLQNDFIKLTKSQKRLFIFSSIAFSLGALVAAFATGSYYFFISTSISFLSLIILELTTYKYKWVVPLIFEAFTIVFAIKDSNLQKGVMIGIHTIYGILILFWIISIRYYNTFPKEINKLQNLKYGPKLA